MMSAERLVSGERDLGDAMTMAAMSMVEVAVVGRRLEMHVVPVRMVPQLLLLVSFVLEPVLNLELSS